MAITVPSQTVETFNLTGDNTAFSVDVPSDVSGGILAGDYIIVIAVHSESEDNDWTPVPPSGMDGTWVTELQVGQTPPSVPGVHVFYELCSGGESGSRTMTADFAGSMSGICFVVRGVDGTTPLDVAVQTVQSTATGDPDPPAITPANDDCMILAVGLQDDTDAASMTSPPTNYTSLAFLNCNESTGHNNMAAYRILSGGGSSSENPGAWNIGANDEWAAATIALRPGAAVSYEQEGFRFRNDNGSESAATWIAAQDTNISRGKTTNTRLRMLADATGDAPSEAATLQYRKVGDPASEWENVN